MVIRMPRKPLPFWAALVLIAAGTTVAFWFFGGQHYLANKGDIDQSLFQNPKEGTEALAWLGLFIYSGTYQACIGFIVSSAIIIGWNWLANHSQ